MNDTYLRFRIYHVSHSALAQAHDHQPPYHRRNARSSNGRQHGCGRENIFLGDALPSRCRRTDDRREGMTAMPVSSMPQHIHTGPDERRRCSAARSPLHHAPVRRWAG